MSDSPGGHHGAAGPARGEPGDGPQRGRSAGAGGSRPVHDDQIPPGGVFGLRVLPAGWMRGALATVTALVTLVVAMGDLASAWVLGVLPLVVAALTAYAEVLERTLADPVDRESGPGH
ncbi:hypothetical protein CC117_01165 [Parafrankia colletiae]|uniref:Uncharacterized protein n=1 Tax=Parafrankia colletiae TaxID=573497 RepID=A0A1S1RJR8_9ACTN|nr:hypothetical protein [Parafrankia colletiae]MCK9899843.1 hypothetical protein [Frankia sp. Cpl3]OHV46287.1 hypothetical protein CC117_01165 [Parafrankia colletiae]